MGNYSEEMLDKMRIAVNKVGLGDSTHLPEALLTNPPKFMFGDFIKRSPKFPSLFCMIVNHYKMNENVLSYNLSGMGCTAGLLVVRLANQLLQVHKGTYALILSIENTTHCCYFGNDHSKLIPNCTFRVGGAAILLSNRPSDRNLCKYELLHDVHTHASGSSYRSYISIFLEEDYDGHVGVSITKDLLIAATNAIDTNLTPLGPLILPLSEKLLFFKNVVTRRIF
ncbi:hypothetical protein HAX54_019321 [Datura stramonium]|uniref:FAE domain-containing protein n=1 Tax=Datura stramonium TaxID=4076 RepID=A0ABS8UNX4_DATST|nr:hypothetical protein [Datura stramonium]